MESDTLIRMQLQLECIGMDDAGRLVRIPGPDTDDLDRIYVRGHGRQPVAAWSAGTLARGKVPFYSHLLDNTGSAALACSFSLVSGALAWAFEGAVYA